MPEVTVFIPFFQREKGLLREAVRSIFEQSIFGAPPASDRWESGAGVDPLPVDLDETVVELLIVDDGSPVSSREELEGLEPPKGLSVRVIEQENRGLVGARNRGMEETDPSTEFFAMIDSDDQWSPWHLERALTALRDGADIYTSNWLDAETGQDAFSLYNKLDLSNHEPLEGMEDGYRFVGSLCRQEVNGSIGRPSALVFRWSRFKDIRNDARLVYASEDQFWRFSMFVREPKLVFSSRPEVSSGLGVSLFSGIDYATTRGILTLRERIFCLRLARRLDGFPADARPTVAAAIGRARRDIVAVAMNRLARGKSPYLRALATLPGKDPGMLLAWPRHVFGVIDQRLRPTREQPSGARVTRWGG